MFLSSIKRSKAVKSFKQSHRIGLNLAWEHTSVKDQGMPNLFFGFCRNGASPPNPSQCAHWDTFHLAWKTLRAVEDASPYDEDEADARLHGKLERFLISNSEFRISNCEFSLAIPAGFEYNSTG